MIDVQTKPAPIEVVTPIRASEAIRLGCLIAPVQAFGQYAAGAGSACAMGAFRLAFGAEHVGHHIYGTHVPGLMEREERLDTRLSQRHCPVQSCDSFDALIPHLNDDHRWSRERIADWLESLGL